MILLLGASGYVGQAFQRELERRDWPFIAVARTQIDYARFEGLLGCLEKLKPAFLINAAGYTGIPNVDACETARAETLLGNTLLPQTIAQACLITGTPWGHVSSGCLFSGAKLVEVGTDRVEKDLTRPEVRHMCEHKPQLIR